jgi:hypothetical protein
MTDGANLNNGKIKIAEGWYADDRLRVGGILYLEEQTGKPFTELADELTDAFGDKDGQPSITTMVSKLSPILKALILQANPELDEDAIGRLLMQMEIEDFMEVFSKIKLFEASAKNPSTPNPATKPKRTRKKVKRRKP